MSEPRRDPPEGPAAGGSELSVARESSGEAAPAILQPILALAVATVDRCDLAGCVIDGYHVAAPASRTPFAAGLLELEDQLDGGPCRDAVVSGAPVAAPDLGGDHRWPRFGDAAALLGVRSAVAVPVPASPGAVFYLYSHLPDAFDRAEAQAALLGALVDNVWGSARARAHAEEHARNLHAALQSREVIGQAQGILMERERMTADEAFSRLRQASQQLNRKLGAVALDIVETGQDPLAGVEPSIIPENESRRAAAVRRYDVLDTPPDGAFDRIAKLAARACGTPIAIISIVDNDRIWFKAHHGTDAVQIGRDPGLCASAILQSEPWIVEDARADPRTLANPLVAGEFGLGFYLGVPLRTRDGYNLGTLCVLDHEPRPATDREVIDLTDLAQIVVDELDLRLAARRTVQLEARLRRQAEDLAAELQASVLPAILPDLADLDLSVRYVPAQRERVGGDFYDAFESGDGHALVIGDVSGHGPSAAALAGLARNTIRAITVDEWSPKSVVEKLNRAVGASPTAEEQRFCTVALMRLRGGPPMAGEIALGGHPQPLVLRADGAIEALGVPGLLLGPFPDAAVDSQHFELGSGDAVILYTDGLIDAAADFDLDALRQALRRLAGLTADRIASGLWAAVRERAPDPRDDIAILVARVKV